MATAAQIITYARTVYPRATASIFPDAFCLENLNDIHIEEYIKLGRLTNYYTTDKTTLTVSGQLEYNLPSNCRIENIESLRVWLTADYYIEYEYADGKTDTRLGYYYKYGSTPGKFELLVNDEAIDTTGLIIEIRFLPTPTEITLTTQTPDLEEQYHSLLKYRLANRLASVGEVIDTDIANVWQSEYDTLWRKIEEDKNLKKNKAIKTIKNVYGGWQ
ncbi:MAG: hypothetical protein GX660_10135 [Clostridiaceae bacterium]|nr:hypothetical protein [Clostridiaceae bacterium]